MARQIVLYRLEADGTVPIWIDDGGYFRDESTNQLVGLSVDSDIWNVPYGLTVLTKADIITRAQSLSFDDSRPPVQFTTQQATDYVNAWLTLIGQPDYA